MDTKKDEKMTRSKSHKHKPVDKSAMVHVEAQTSEKFIDSHVHLDMVLKTAKRVPETATAEELVAALDEYYASDLLGANFAGAVHVCCLPRSRDFTLKTVLERPQYAKWFHPAFGVHPLDCLKYSDELEKDMIELLNMPCCVGFGEIGLDYHYEGESCPKDKQIEVFMRQLRIARDIGKPVVIHARECEDDDIRIISEALPADFPVHLHCYTGSYEHAFEFLRRCPGTRIGLTGCATFKTAPQLRDIARDIEPTRLLLETDGPFMAPAPHRGYTSHPGLIPDVAACLAATRGMTPDELLSQCYRNTCELYRIDP